MNISQAILPTGSVEMVVRARLPTCIQADYWRRHELSRNDIDTIASYIPTKLMWISAMVHGIHCPWFSLRSSSSSPIDVTYSGKAIAIDAILDKVNIRPSDTDKLDVNSLESFEHIPPIPRYSINSADFLHISSGITSGLVPRSLLVPSECIGSIPLTYNIKGKTWVPVGIEGDAVCCNSIVNEECYVYKDGPKGVTHDPKVGIYKSAVYCLTDELILLSTS